MTDKKFTPKVKRRITLPILQLEPHVAVFIRVEEKVYVGKETPGEGDKKKEKPADLCRVTNLETGELMIVIVPTILLSTWTEEFPDDSYVGKGFSITKMDKPKGKRYFKYNIDELEL